MNGGEFLTILQLLAPLLPRILRMFRLPLSQRKRAARLLSDAMRELLKAAPDVALAESYISRARRLLDSTGSTDRDLLTAEQMLRSVQEHAGRARTRRRVSRKFATVGSAGPATAKKARRKKTVRRKVSRRKTARKKAGRKKAVRKKTARKKAVRKKASRKKAVRRSARRESTRPRS